VTYSQRKKDDIECGGERDEFGGSRVKRGWGSWFSNTTLKIKKRMPGQVGFHLGKKG